MNLIRGCIVLFLLFTNNSVFAATNSATLRVSAQVLAVCVVTSSTLNFNSAQAAGSGAGVPGVCRFNIACTNGLDASVLVSKGANTAYSGQSTRALRCGSNFVSYELYSDADCKNVWDENNALIYSSTSGKPFSMTVYAKAFVSEDTPPGTYSDQVIVNPSCPIAKTTPGALQINLVVPPAAK